MRVLLIAVVLLGALAPLGSAHAADHHAASPVSTTADAGVDIDIDDNDDDVLEVQLFVLGVVIATVFVLGTGAYLLRRKLGLTVYTPPADSGHH